MVCCGVAEGLDAWAELLVCRLAPGRAEEAGLVCRALWPGELTVPWGVLPDRLPAELGTVVGSVPAAWVAEPVADWRLCPVEAGGEELVPCRVDCPGEGALLPALGVPGELVPLLSG